jgi:hypothetical protein
MLACKIKKNNHISDAIRFRHRPTDSDSKKKQRFGLRSDFSEKAPVGLLSSALSLEYPLLLPALPVLKCWVEYHLEFQAGGFSFSIRPLRPSLTKA